MDIMELVTILGLTCSTAFFLILTLLGKGEIKIKFMKMTGGFKGKIIAKEIRKDGKVYTHRVKIYDNRIKIGNRTYDYNINNTVVNKYDLREGYFSEMQGKQLDPYTFKTNIAGLSADTISQMLIMATSVAMIPKPMLNTKALPIIVIIIAIVIVVAMITGGATP